MSIQIFTETLAIEHCCHEGCGMAWGMLESYQDKRLRDHRDFYCPQGHRQHYVGQSDVEKAREAQSKAERIAQAERDRHERTRQELAHTEARRRAEKGAKTKLKKRIRGGVCPCCNRSFAQLARHIKGQHPEYQP